MRKDMMDGGKEKGRHKGRINKGWEIRLNCLLAYEVILGKWIMYLLQLSLALFHFIIFVCFFLPHIMWDLE